MKHGLRYTRLYGIWLQIKNRCYNPKTGRYGDYGARGIKVCDEWCNDFKAFYDWAMANGYRDDLSIDRKDVNGNYEPSNCKWATVKEQARNKRNNHILTLNGVSHCLMEWCEITGLSRGCIQNRLKYGWTVEETLTRPKGYNVGVSKNHKHLI